VSVPDESILSLLDEYEGYDAADPARPGFVREETFAHRSDGSRVACWIYAYRGDLTGAVPILDGDYRASRSRP
jgi:gamma-glutamylcyclotransferase (GGCT)/AIG2-like uncharacterized protein YtfP